VTLHLAPCSHEAALFAVRSWHYSRSVPCPPSCRYGVWEDARFVGSVIFARGSNRHLGRPFGLRTDEIGELARVALAPHATPTSRIVAVAVRLLRQQCPGLRLLVSFADPAQSHRGTLYRALGWTFVGETSPSAVYMHRGRKLHPRQVGADGRKRQFGMMRVVPRIADCERIEQPPKLRFCYALDPRLRLMLASMARPYPRERSAESGTLASSQRGRCDATRSLHQTETAHVS
jgi:hypothetical protein